MIVKIVVHVVQIHIKQVDVRENNQMIVKHVQIVRRVNMKLEHAIIIMIGHVLIVQVLVLLGNI